MKQINDMKNNYQGRKYKILDYDNSWQKDFEKEADILGSILGEEVISIEHIGSTAVPGLAGKPIIDILAIVKDVSIADDFLVSLKSAGYEYLGEYVMPGTKLFVREEKGNRLVNLHFFPEDHSSINEMIGLRDYLRKNPEEVDSYGKFKKELVKKYPESYGEYRKAKDEYMAELLRRVCALTIDF